MSLFHQIAGETSAVFLFKKLIDILLNDDSGVVRQAMKELLGEDYEVMLAESGVSALRCMILDRPDLVLLDYEMPICDGRQVLEMIRAEKGLADLDVIFLTGNTNRENIKKIAALKPAGAFSALIVPPTLSSSKCGAITQNAK